MDAWLNRPVYPGLRLESLTIADETNAVSSEAALNSSEFQNFSTKLSELHDGWANDKTLESFRLQHEALRKSFVKANQLERKFVEKCSEFEQKLKDHEQLLKHAIQLSHDHEATTVCLRKEVQSVTQKADNGLEKERSAAQIFMRLREEVSSLHRYVH